MSFIPLTSVPLDKLFLLLQLPCLATPWGLVHVDILLATGTIWLINTVAVSRPHEAKAPSKEPLTLCGELLRPRTSKVTRL